jgi:integrase/recombinase XerD
MDKTIFIQDYLQRLKEKEYSKDTIRQYRYILRKLFAIELDKHGIEAFQKGFLNLKPKSRNRYFLITKKILADLDPKLEKYIIIPKLPEELPKNIPGQEEISAILQKPDVSTFRGIRDRTILELLYSTGIRRMELVCLTVEDLDLNQGLLRINQGKMKKDRIVPAGKVSVQWLKKYLEWVRPALNPKNNALFLSRTGGRMNEGTPNKIIKKYSANSPHKYRHSFATHLLQNGMKETSLQRLLGHSQVSTTQIYTRVTIHDLRASYTKYHKRDCWRC